MKNKILILGTAVLLCGCSGQTYDHSLSILAPTGAPAVAFYNYSGDANFSTSSDATTIIPEMVKKNKDVVVLPTNAGINAIVKQKVDYKIAATITFGNLYIASTGHDNDKVMDKDDYIIIFQEKGVPGLIFKSIYGDTLNDGLHPVGDVSLASKCLMSGKDVTRSNEDVDYVLIAEPAFTNVKSKKENVKEYANLQKEYKNKYSTEIFQASVFVKNGVDADVFLSSLEEDINAALKDSSVVEEATKDMSDEQAAAKYGVAPKMAAANLKNGNRMGLGFKRAKYNKEGIDKFLSIFGIDATSEEIYY